MGNTLNGGKRQRIGLTAHPPFDHAIGVDRARFKLIETMTQRMFQMIDMEIAGTSFIGAIEERTIVCLFFHAMTLTPCASFSIIGE